MKRRATRLVMNEDGSVAGVVAEQDGAEILIEAKAVVIASGGYSYNPELTGLLDPEMAGTYGIGHPASTGDGIINLHTAGNAQFGNRCFVGDGPDIIAACLGHFVEDRCFTGGRSAGANAAGYVK